MKSQISRTSLRGTVLLTLACNLLIALAFAHDSHARGNHDKGRPTASLSKNEIIEVQKALKERGFDPGKVDGTLSMSTTQALKKFQSQNQLQATGQPDSKTLAALGVSKPGQSAGEVGKEAHKAMREMKEKIMPGQSQESAEERKGEKSEDVSRGTTTQPHDKKQHEREQELSQAEVSETTVVTE